MSSLLDLPNSSAATVSLEVASADEELLLRTRNAPNWKGPLSVDGYVRREAFLGLQDATKDGGLTTWVLVDRKGTKRLILASCETYRKRAYVGRKGYVQEVSCHAVGSVFCPPEMRSRGYATRMMEDLRSRLVTWQIEESPCYFSILFSDIGKVWLS